jgi:hypothetical protein
MTSRIIGTDPSARPVLVLPPERPSVEEYEVFAFEAPSSGPVGSVTDTVGGVTDTVSGATGNLLGSGEKS